MLIHARAEKIMKYLPGTQVLITDPAAINYLLEKRFYPGERFLGLLLREGKEPLLYLNELFPLNEDLGLRRISFSDTDDIIGLIAEQLDETQPLGVDKNMTARFLLPMIDRQIVPSFFSGSLAVDRARAVKDESEIEKMRRASAVNDEAMCIFKTLIHDGVSEKEVADQLLGIYQSLGASGYSFDPIVSFGRNCADPHHMPDDTVVQEGDAVLFDVGCVVDGYCSDMTRTFFYKKEPSAEQVRVYNLVRQANETAESVLKAGIPLCDIDKTARDIIADGGFGPYFTHRLGHFIGTEVHEYGDVSAAFAQLTEPGNTFSIEPGIYDPQLLGCRIEDLVLITEEGHEVLNSYPHEIEIIG